MSARSLFAVLLAMALLAAPPAALANVRRDKAGDVRAKGLTKKERKALDIVKVDSRLESWGLTVTVTLAGNFDKAVGRGHLRRAGVAIGIKPRKGKRAVASASSQIIVGTVGAGRRQREVGTRGRAPFAVIRNGRKLKFLINGDIAERSRLRVVTLPSTKRPRRKARRSQLDAFAYYLGKAIVGDSTLMEIPIFTVPKTCPELIEERARLADQLQEVNDAAQHAAAKGKKLTEERLKAEANDLSRQITEKDRVIAVCKKNEGSGSGGSGGGTGGGGTGGGGNPQSCASALSVTSGRGDEFTLTVDCQNPFNFLHVKVFPGHEITQLLPAGCSIQSIGGTNNVAQCAPSNVTTFQTTIRDNRVILNGSPPLDLFISSDGGQSFFNTQKAWPTQPFNCFNFGFPAGSPFDTRVSVNCNDVPDSWVLDIDGTHEMTTWTFTGNCVQKKDDGTVVPNGGAGPVRKLDCTQLLGEAKTDLIADIDKDPNTSANWTLRVTKGPDTVTNTGSD